MALKPLRIGVFGGAFDPPHNAHRALAACAIAQLGLAELRVLPTGQAWHKTAALSAPAHRLAMTRLAFDGLAGARVDPRELHRPGPTYTLDTLRELQGEHPQAQLVLVIGADQAETLPRWHGWTDILSLAIISVAERPMDTGAASGFDPQTLPGPPAGARFERIALPAMDVSATAIRARVAAGLPIGHLVAPAVARYIDQHHLYSKP